ncbi:MAG: export transporter permease LptG, partial [Rhizobacter sp.]|nr:export transporter permease LptG [Rhizobacter sp.]
MKTVRRLLYSEVLTAIAFVALAFLALFYFIDFVDEIDGVGKNGYTIMSASLFTLLEVPGHFYELLPISVLIGAIYALSRLAQSSEFTILRTGGLSPGRALWLLAVLGIGFAALTFVTGDYLAPLSDRVGSRLHASYRGDMKLAGAGAWLKDRQSPGVGDHNFSVNVQGVASDGRLQDVRIFEFDADGRRVSRLSAATAVVGRDGRWGLSKVLRTQWTGADDSNTASVTETQMAEFEWPSTLSQNVVAAALQPANTMSTLELY